MSVLVPAGTEWLMVHTQTNAGHEHAGAALGKRRQIIGAKGLLQSL